MADTGNSSTARTRQSSDDHETRQLTRYAWILAVAWTAVLCASLAWNLTQLRLGVVETARTQARGAFEMTVLTRRWNAAFGGVYAPVLEGVPPNPYLKVPERDIETPSGRQLTLINPAYMTRQINELLAEESGYLGHITSLNPIRPENAADAWETEALQSFMLGETEVSSIEEIDGVPYMRLMRPLATEGGCLQCHAQQGYELGDIRGGISVSVPTAPLLAISRNATLSSAGGHVVLWVLGLSGIRLGESRIRQGLKARSRAELKLWELNATLEEQVIARTAEIRAEKEKSETILNSTGDAIVVTDLEGQASYINPAFKSLTGYSSQDVIGRSIAFLFKVPEQADSLRTIIENGEPWRGDVLAFRKDGRSYDAALTVAPIHDADENVVGHVASHRDISQQKRLERARTEFLANVSHQFRTPVTTLRLYAHMMLMADLPKSARSQLEMMDREIDWLSQLIQDALEMTSLDSGKSVTTWGPVSPLELIEGTVTGHHHQAREARLTLTVVPLPPDMPEIEGDQARLAQALGEVLENAIIFTPPGGQIALKADTIESDGKLWVTIAVEDSGPGILPEEQNDVFDRFFRGSLAESGHVPGVGLGLSIAHEILRAHSGRITVESGTTGSTFTLWIPAGAA